MSHKALIMQKRLRASSNFEIIAWPTRLARYVAAAECFKRGRQREDDDLLGIRFILSGCHYRRCANSCFVVALIGVVYVAAWRGSLSSYQVSSNEPIPVHMLDKATLTAERTKVHSLSHLILGSIPS